MRRILEVRNNTYLIPCKYLDIFHQNIMLRVVIELSLSSCIRDGGDSSSKRKRQSHQDTLLNPSTLINRKCVVFDIISLCLCIRISALCSKFRLRNYLKLLISMECYEIDFFIQKRYGESHLHTLLNHVYSTSPIRNYVVIDIISFCLCINISALCSKFKYQNYLIP